MPLRSKRKPSKKSRINKEKTKYKIKNKSKSIKKKRKSNVKKALGPSNTDASAIVEYLVYKPINSKKNATKFYKDIDSQWADDANYVNVIVMESLKINDLQILKDVADKLLKSCKRKNTNGDCEDRAKDIMDELKPYSNSQGKYAIEYHRAEYYETESSDYDEETGEYKEAPDPEFVQNHAYVVAYDTKNKNQHWFRYTEDLT